MECPNCKAAEQSLAQAKEELAKRDERIRELATPLNDAEKSWASVRADLERRIVSFESKLTAETDRADKNWVALGVERARLDAAESTARALGAEKSNLQEQVFVMAKRLQEAEDLRLTQIAKYQDDVRALGERVKFIEEAANRVLSLCVWYRDNSFPHTCGPTERHHALCAALSPKSREKKPCPTCAMPMVPHEPGCPFDKKSQEAHGG